MLLGFVVGFCWAFLPYSNGFLKFITVIVRWHSKKIKKKKPTVPGEKLLREKQDRSNNKLNPCMV